MSEKFLGATQIRQLASSLDLSPTKKWGQNFVIDPNTVRRIVDVSGVTADDDVIEIGPGFGSLTVGLLSAANSVVAVEIDERLATQLPKTILELDKDLAQKLIVLNTDALKLAELPTKATKLVANLPYNISVPVILHFLEKFPSIREVLVMVQAEVGERLAAGPGSKIYGVPSVKARFYGEVSQVATISRQIFWPVPNVDSVLVRIIRHQESPDLTMKQQLFSVVDAAFSQRRKTLRSALSSFLGGSARVDAVLAQAGVNSGLRGEQLDIDAFLAISKAAQQVK
ncbi:MAG: 16S rRNA (adenine(1518)-N(6)/adenine(1519)-N(6))-dimethyltransferase RsmA [Actinobacteria bacterium]|nr:16S rRNA (adenine(1518)-N(6)/adenine(1519)-N(6))-dimethyltransferase RsmA [Actinomycetota bacterium]